MTRPAFHEPMTGSGSRTPDRKQSNAVSNKPFKSTRSKNRRSASLDTPEARDHAQEAEELRAALIDVGAPPDMVAPTRDYQGHVRLNFDAAWALVDQADELAELKAKLAKMGDDA